MTALGLTPADVDGLRTVEKRALVAWTLGKAGGVVEGEIFIPNAIRDVPLAERLRLALDPMADSVWMERERRRVVASPIYFTKAYGHMQGQTGPAMPIELWPLVERAAELAIGARTQEEVLEVLWREKRTLMLKARQLGMTWLVLHYAYWTIAFRADTPLARALALSKRGDDASKLLARARRIRDLLPPFLRHEESSETKGSKTELQLVGRGRLISLPGTPDAARMETATFVMFDEAAFPKNEQAGPTLTALEPTLGEEGQLCILSTGNGESGDGAAFADEVRKALDGASARYFVFLPASTDPKRDEAWRDRARRNYLSDQDFQQEHPEDVDQALAGTNTIKVYPAAHLAAAAKIGAALDAAGKGREIAAAEGVEFGTDWGDFQTFTTWGVGLPAGGRRALSGLYLVAELLQALVDPEEASEAIFDFDLVDAIGVDPVKVASRADASPPGNNRLLARRLARRRDREPGRWPEKHVNVPFGVYKEGGGKGKRGVNTVAYLQSLLGQAHDLVQQPGWDDPDRLDEIRGVLAISPRCAMLLKQMRNLEKDPHKGTVRKPDPDPKRPEHGDHGPDSVVALSYRRAEKWTMAATKARGDEAEA